MGLVVKNGTLVTAADQRPGDVLCRDGKIVAVGEDVAASAADRVVDASGQYVFPAGVDPHVHLSLPVAETISSDDFESGSRAALAGGTTTLIDFVHPERGQDPLEALAARRVEAAASVVDYGLHMAVTWWGEGTSESMRRCVRDQGIPSFKVYMAYLETVGLADADLVRVMAEAKRLGALVMVHAEHGEIIDFLRRRIAGEGHLEPRCLALSRPPEAEGEATHRATVLAHLTGARLYVVHVTCGQSVGALEAARKQGWEVRGETCPQYLVLDEAEYERPDFAGAAYVMAPPLRARSHQAALWAALGEGMLDVVATDHCPFNMVGQKDLGRNDFRRIPGGAAGVEHRLQLLYTHGVRAGRIDLRRFVDLVSTGPARLFGLYPRKGSLEPGADADLVVWDPAATSTISAATHRHRCDCSVYEGMEVRGTASTVIARGRIAFQDGQFQIEKGSGQFLKREY